MQICILMADWPPLKAFDIHAASAEIFKLNHGALSDSID